MVDSDTPFSDLPVPSDEERAEIAQAIEALENDGGADPAEIERMLGKLSVMFPSAKVSNAEARARIAIYGELLSDIPPAILGEAFRTVARTNQWFPTVAEIRKAAGPALAIQSWRKMRLKGLALKYDHDHGRGKG